MKKEIEEKYQSVWYTESEVLDEMDQDRVIVLFDNGQKIFYNDDWPFAEAIAWYELPPFPSDFNPLNQIKIK